MENHEDVHQDDLLERAVDAVLRDPTPDELPPDQVAQLVAIVRHAADQPYPITLIERIKNMKLRTKIAVAAAVLVAFVGLMSWLVPGGGVALALADVAEALNNVHSATWKTTQVVEVKGPQTRTITTSVSSMFLAPSHERTERTVEGEKSIDIYDGEKHKSICLVPAAKTAVVINLKNLPPTNPFGKTFQGLRELVANAQSGKAGKVERLGVQTIDGRRAEGFRIRVGDVEAKVWADPKTSLPIRIEKIFSAAPESRLVMTDFQTGVDLDESLFSLDVPAGYTVYTTEMDASKKPMACLADALKWAAEHNDGMFPPALRGEQGIGGIMQRADRTLAKKNGNNSLEVLKLHTDVPVNLGRAFGFLLALPPDAWHYAGKDVKLGTPNRPIFWLKPKNGAQCLVIYADLSIKEVSPEEAPKVPQSEGSPKQ